MQTSGIQEYTNHCLCIGIYRQLFFSEQCDIVVLEDIVCNFHTLCRYSAACFVYKIVYISHAASNNTHGLSNHCVS